MTQLDYIELPGSPLGETKDFYSAAFEFDWIDYGPTYAATSGGLPHVALNALATACPTPTELSENGLGPFLLFSTMHLAETQKMIIDAGGKIIVEPYPYPGGVRLHFQDPAMNILGVYQSDTQE